MNKDLKFFTYFVLTLFIIGILLGISKFNDSSFDVYYKNKEVLEIKETSLLCLRSVETNQYEIVEVSSDYSIETLFNENRNALPVNYYIDNYSNYFLTYINNENGIINCVVDNFDGDKEVFLNCFVSSLFLNDAQKVFVKINGELYIFNESLSIDELNKK